MYKTLVTVLLKLILTTKRNFSTDIYRNQTVERVQTFGKIDFNLTFQSPGMAENDSPASACFLHLQTSRKGLYAS